MAEYKVQNVAKFASGLSEGVEWVAVGPGVAGLAGAIPRFQPMTQRDADHLAGLLNTAYRAGVRAAQSDMRSALGLEDWGGDVKVS